MVGRLPSRIVSVGEDVSIDESHNDFTPPSVFHAEKMCTHSTSRESLKLLQISMYLHMYVVADSIQNLPEFLSHRWYRQNKDSNFDF